MQFEPHIKIHQYIGEICRKKGTELVAIVSRNRNMKALAVSMQGLDTLHKK
jgi:hypothetical protein